MNKRLAMLILALLLVGSGGFIAGYFFAGQNRADEYAALQDYDLPVYEEYEADVLEANEEVDEPYEARMGIAIYVYNPLYQYFVREAIMHSVEDAVGIEFMLARRYVTPYTVDVELYPAWMLVPVEVDDDTYFSTRREVVARLERRVRQNFLVVVQEGDCFEDIAYAWGMELEDFFRINQITYDTAIIEGMRLNVFTTSRLMSVITIDVTEYIVPKARPIEVFYVTTLPPQQMIVRQEGRDGHIGVLIMTTRKNGVVIEEEVHRRVLEPAIPRIQEIGI